MDIVGELFSVRLSVIKSTNKMYLQMWIDNLKQEQDQISDCVKEAVESSTQQTDFSSVSDISILSHKAVLGDEDTYINISLGSFGSLSSFTSTSSNSVKFLLDEAWTPLGLHSGLELLSMVSCREQLRILCDITKDSIFTNVHMEVTRSTRDVISPKLKDMVRTETTFNLTSVIVDQSLNLMNSAITEAYLQAGEDSLLVLNSSKDVAQQLLSAMMTEMQDFVQLCIVSDKPSASAGPALNLYDRLEDMLPLVTRKTVTSVLDSLLQVCSEGTSEDFKEVNSKAPLYNFIEAVVDKQKSAMFKADSQSHSGAPSSIRRPSSPLLGRMRPKPRCERVLENIIFYGMDGKCSPFTTELNPQLFSHSTEDFLDEASTMVSCIIMNETAEMTRRSRSSNRGDLSTSALNTELKSSTLSAASSVVITVMSELKNILENECWAADLSTDPSLYAQQVQKMSDKVLESAQPVLKDAFVRNLQMRAHADFSTCGRAGLHFGLLEGSRKIPMSIIESITTKLQLPVVSDSLRPVATRFLQFLKGNLEDQIELQLLRSFINFTAARRAQTNAGGCRSVHDIQLHQSSPAEVNTSSVDRSDAQSARGSEKQPESSRRRFLPFKLPKIKNLKLGFKKQTNKKETTVLSEVSTQESSAPPMFHTSADINNRISTAILAPKKKPFFSRVADRFSKIFRKSCI